ncbi:hypothetical protein ONZ45_g12081 [Pleurotus djamor]|nr:hypothetical protein ONZ45_g12081 [Pleurotus djamor]
MSSSPPPTKRRKTTPEHDSEDSDASSSHSNEEEIAYSSDDNSPDTEDEVAAAKRSLKTGKRKRRATEPSKFGSTLQSLLSTDAPSDLPLSLKPSVNRKRNDEQLNIKAKKLLQVEKKEKEETGRVRDVIGGWGGENERALRKVAQRGVVKLFNLIQQSQATAAAVVEKSKSERGSGKPSLPAPVIEHRKVGVDDFFDMIRSGGIVSKQ